MSERFVDSNCAARPTLSGSILLLYDYNKLFRVKIIKGDYEEGGWELAQSESFYLGELRFRISFIRMK